MRMEENTLGVRDKYCEMLQNSVLFSPVYGQAEVMDGLPFYCNGKNLLVVGYSVDNSRSRLQQRVGHVIEYAHQRWRESLQTIQFWGPECPTDHNIPSDFIRTDERRPNHSNRDVVLLLDNVARRRVSSGRDIRRAKRNGLSVTINASKAPTLEHSRIFDGFLLTHDNIEDEDMAYFRSWTKVLQDKDSLLFEVRRNNALTGFSVLSCFGSRTATYAYGFFNNSITGTSDLAHGAMIEYCLSAGFDELDLGYSIHASLLRYKRKWGTTRLIDPPWSVYWRWRGSAFARLK